MEMMANEWLNNCLWRIQWRRLLHGFHIVGGQHAKLPGSLHGTEHPAFGYWISIKYDIALNESDFIVLASLVIKDCSIGLRRRLKQKKTLNIYLARTNGFRIP